MQHEFYITLQCLRCTSQCDIAIHLCDKVTWPLINGPNWLFIDVRWNAIPISMNVAMSHRNYNIFVMKCCNNSKITIINYNILWQNTLIRNSSKWLLCTISCNNFFIKNPSFFGPWISQLYFYVLMVLVDKDAIGSMTCVLSTCVFMIDLYYCIIWYVQVHYPYLLQHIFHTTCFIYLYTSNTFS